VAISSICAIGRRIRAWGYTIRLLTVTVRAEFGASAQTVAIKARTLVRRLAPEWTSVTASRGPHM
jgi:hypothetical protein